MSRHSGWEQVRERLHDIFVAEAAERLAALDVALLALEGGTEGSADDRGPRNGDLQHHLSEAFRQAHTLKGGARAAGLPEVERVAHGLESAFDRLRSGARAGPDTWGAIYAAADAVKALVAGRAADVDAVVAALEEPAQPPAGLPPVPGAEPATPATATAGSPVVRVPVARLDSLLAEMRELHAVLGGLRQRGSEARVLAAETSRLARLLRQRRRRRQTGPSATGSLEAPPDGLGLVDDMGRLRRRLDADLHRLEQVVAELQATAGRLRMVPVGVALAGLPRLLRDTATACGKQARLELVGTEAEVDRSVIEEISGVLAHLVRNAVDHGLEDPTTRALAGKPATGVVTVEAREERGTLTILVSDDGDGIDEDAVRRRAVELGLVSADQAAVIGLDLVFRAGFSTARQITEVSGRGVGLDAVRATVEGLGGTVTLGTEPGGGTTVRLTLPLALATMRCLVVESGGHRLALPLAAVTRVVRLDEGAEVPVTPVELTRVLGLRPVPGAAPPRLAVLAVSGATTAAVLVDAIGAEEQIVVHTLPAPLRRVRFTAGATILGTGELVPVLHAGEVFRAAAGDAPVALPEPGAPGAPGRPGRRVVVVADDSVTTRTLERVILESAGYEVRVAADGAQALALVQAGGCHALVSDVEMPVLDGLTLCETLRADRRFRDFPVVLLTALGSSGDRDRGVAAGADAYIVKGEFDQETLLATLRRLL